jgi:hypothetical protein
MKRFPKKKKKKKKRRIKPRALKVPIPERVFSAVICTGKIRTAGVYVMAPWTLVAR